MNYSLTLKILGVLVAGLGGTMLAPTLVAWYYEDASLEGFIVSTLIAIACGLVLSQIRPAQSKLNLKSSIGVVVGSWIAFSLFGALPYWFSANLSFTDAAFETMSGFTTTGASIANNIEGLGPAILFWRSMTQWLGGMGIIVLSLAIMPLLGASGTVLYRAEVPGPSSDKLMPRLQATAKILWVVYVVFTITSAIFLRLAGMSWFDAVCHSFTTISTGGFSTQGSSIAAYSSPLIEWGLIVFMFIGGANFSLHYRLFQSRSFKGYFKNREFLFYILLILGASLAISTQIGIWEDPHHSIRTALFQVISIVTTTGYATANYEAWAPFAQYIVFLLLFVGGCGGSTSGGIKLIRIFVVGKIAIKQILQVLHPQGVYTVKIGKTSIPEDFIGSIMGFVILYMILIAVASLALSFFGHDLLTALTAVVTCLGNVGPGFGDVGPIENFSTIADPAKWILFFCMLAGRLEIFTILVLFTREYWRK
jgi:trk system potassium uptake protein TrkH